MSDSRDPAHWFELGVERRRSGDREGARDAFERALELDSAHVAAILGRAGCLAEAGNFDAAAEGFAAAIEFDPGNARAHLYLGNVLRIQGNLDGAIVAWKASAHAEPDAPEGWTNLIAGLTEAGRGRETADAYRAALEAGASSPDLHANMAQADIAIGDYAAAKDAAMAGLSLDAGHVSSATALAAARLESGDVEGAIVLARQITERAPDNHEAWNLLGAAHDRRRETDDAIAAYERALKSAPGDINARMNLADLYERTNALGRAQAIVDSVLEKAPNQPFANRVAATLERRRDDTDAGLRRLVPFADADVPARTLQSIHFELGRLYDRDGDADRAFAHFAEGNRLQRDSSLAAPHDPARYVAQVDSVTAALRKDWFDRWPAVPAASKTPVFLVGFPRSGTTLLDQILDSHPGIQVVEEKPMLEEIAREMPGYPEALAELSESEVEALRDRYWWRAGEFIERDPGTVLVDKLPLNIEKVLLIYRLFPDARFIVALRHPADCVLSCFMQAFRPNIAMNNFHTVEDAARLYDKVFGLWERARGLLPLRVHHVRYEDLVADFRREVEPLLAFLDLSWDECVQDYARNPGRRGRINTPSYNQVTEPIYTRASGRWVRYRAHMEKALETLAPWIERYGYGA